MSDPFSTGTPKRHRNYEYFFYEPKKKKINYVEFGGKTVKEGFRLVRLMPSSKIQDELVSVTGPDLVDMEEGSTHSIGIIIDVSGSGLEEGVEASLEIRVNEFLQFVPGVLTLSCGRNLWFKVLKTDTLSFHTIGKLLNHLFKAEIPVIQKIQTTFYIDKNTNRKISL